MIKKLSLIALLALVLAGCGPIYNTSYTYQAPAGIQAKQCVITCQQAKTICNSACMTANSQCEANTERDARFQYHEYLSKMRLAGKPPQRDLSSFVNDYQCNRQCGCTRKFNNCYTMCGGQVLVHKKCVAFCGKNN